MLDLTHISAPARAGFEGFGLGVAVMIVLGLALVYAFAMSARVVLDRPLSAGPGWIAYAIPILSVLGLAVASYLTYVETRQVAAVCGPVGDCNTVQSSPYARLFGVLPVGLLGALGYVVILALWGYGKIGRGVAAELAPLGVFGCALFGVLFSGYLTYLELAVILAVCLWCLTSAVIMALLLVLSAGPALGRLSAGNEEG